MTSRTFRSLATGHNEVRRWRSWFADAALRRTSIRDSLLAWVDGAQDGRRESSDYWQSPHAWLFGLAVPIEDMIRASEYLASRGLVAVERTDAMGFSVEITEEGRECAESGLGVAGYLTMTSKPAASVVNTGAGVVNVMQNSPGGSQVLTISSAAEGLRKLDEWLAAAHRMLVAQGIDVQPIEAAQAELTTLQQASDPVEPGRLRRSMQRIGQLVAAVAVGAAGELVATGIQGPHLRDRSVAAVKVENGAAGRRACQRPRRGSHVLGMPSLSRATKSQNCGRRGLVMPRCKAQAVTVWRASGSEQGRRARLVQLSAARQGR